LQSCIFKDENGRGDSVEGTYRKFQQSDMDILIDFMGKLHADDLPPFNGNSAREAVEQLANDPSLGELWVILKDERVVGYIVITLGFSLEFHGRDAFVDELYIDEPFRGQGLGGFALDFAASQCRQMSVRALHLEVEEGNHVARGLYTKHGFADRKYRLMTKSL
jgi:ribosomal protein S18 acetylase RimI-like enzyme